MYVDVNNYCCGLGELHDFYITGQTQQSLEDDFLDQLMNLFYENDFISRIIYTTNDRPETKRLRDVVEKIGFKVIDTFPRRSDHGGNNNILLYAYDTEWLKYIWEDLVSEWNNNWNENEYEDEESTLEMVW